MRLGIERTRMFWNPHSMSSPSPAVKAQRLWGRCRSLAQALRTCLREDPQGRSAVKVVAGGALITVGALLAVGDAATLVLGLLVALGLALVGHHLEPPGVEGALGIQRGEGVHGNLHLVAYAAALAVAGYALINMVISLALLLGGGLLLRSGWHERGEEPSRALLTDARRLLREAEGEIRRAVQGPPE
ncbi:MAG: hypothetical protein ACLFMS_06895 [Halorhodospira sp.]